MSKIFVSHSHQDNTYCRAFVRALREKIEQQGQHVDVWYDETNLGAGVISETIEKQLRACQYYIVILSPAALRSDWVNAEMDAVLSLRRKGRKITFVPVIAESCDIPSLLERFNRVQDTETPEDAAEAAYEKLFFIPERSSSTHVAPEVTIINTIEDPLLDQFVELYEASFPREERATEEDMRRYIQEAKEEEAKVDWQYLEDLMVVTLDGELVTFINYTFYRDTRYVFISYVGNKQLVSTEPTVMKALLTRFGERMNAVNCQGIVFEVENKNKRQDTKRVNKKDPPSRIHVFKHWLRRFAQQFKTRIYEVDFPFIQPYLEIDQVEQMPGGIRTLYDRLPGSVNTLGLAKKLVLGFVPLPMDRYATTKKIGKPELLELLRFVYQEVYGDSFIEDDEENALFKAYMKRVLDYYRRTLPNTVKLR